MNKIRKPIRSTQCPQCSELLEPTSPYTPWCYHCNWNVSPKGHTDAVEQQKPSTRLERLCGSLDQKLLHTMIASYKDGRYLPAASFQIYAIILATIVYTATILFIILSTWFIYPQSAIGAVVFAILAILLSGWATSPRFEAHPPKDVLADANEFPELNSVVAEIAKVLNVEMPDILLTEQFDATFGRIGSRRRPLLFLGHPFLSVLEPEELVGLIAHELAHDKDHSASSNLFVQIAYSAVGRWCRILSPWFVTSYTRLLTPVAILLMPFWLLLVAFKEIFSLVRRRDGHRAEYIADQLSISVSGNINTESLMRKSLYGHLFPLKKAYTNAAPANKYHALRHQLGTVPNRELERLWRIAHLMTTNDFSQTHPPIQYRLEFVKSCGQIKAKVELSDESFATLKRELIKWPCVINQREAAVMAKLNREKPESDSDSDYGMSVAAAD